MKPPTLDQLRADGRMVVDAPSRKLAVYSNRYGGIVLMAVDGGRTTYCDLDPDELPGFSAALLRAAGEVRDLVTAMQAEFDTHLVIHRAKGVTP
jgi:hypothetical protein